MSRGDLEGPLVFICTHRNICILEAILRKRELRFGTDCVLRRNFQLDGSPDRTYRQRGAEHALTATSAPRGAFTRIDGLC